MKFESSEAILKMNRALQRMNEKNVLYGGQIVYYSSHK